MDDINNSELFSFDSPLDESTYIKVIGVGGGGNNAVNHMYRKGIKGVDFIVSNTDMKALNSSPVPTKFVLGKTGLGAGGRPEKARQAAEEKAEEIKQLFSENTKMIFVTAGMGGGTGTGAAPVIARLAKEIKLLAEEDDGLEQILVVAVVTTPFMFEGNRRLQQAQEGVKELSKYVDSILVINNEKLRAYGDLCMSDAFSMANDVLFTAVKGIAEIITLKAYVNIDFHDVNTVMEHSGTAIMGIGTGKGENRAHQAVEQAATSVLLNDSNIAGAKNVLLYYSFGPDHEITMDELGEVADYITHRTGSHDTNVIWGAGTDSSLDDELKITLIATGFEQTQTPESRVYSLSEDPTPDDTTPVPAVPTAIDDITLIRHGDDTLPADSTPADLSAATDDVHPTEEAPTDNAETTAGTQNRRVIPLYDETETQPVITTFNDTDDIDTEIRLISRSDTSEAAAADTPAQPVADNTTPAPAVSAETPVAAAPAMDTPQTIRTPQPSRLDIETQQRAERIKRMHDLLRNNAYGPQLVESMNPMELTGEKLYELTHSSKSEVSRTFIDSDGNVKKNPELFGLAD